MRLQEQHILSEIPKFKLSTGIVLPYANQSEEPRERSESFVTLPRDVLK